MHLWSQEYIYLYKYVKILWPKGYERLQVHGAYKDWPLKLDISLQNESSLLLRTKLKQYLRMNTDSWFTNEINKAIKFNSWSSISRRILLSTKIKNLNTDSLSNDCGFNFSAWIEPWRYVFWTSPLILSNKNSLNALDSQMPTRSKWSELIYITLCGIIQYES